MYDCKHLHLVLASSSPRRQEYLHLITDDFVIRVSGADETLPRPMPPREAVTHLARIKAQAVLDELGSGHTVLGCDTLVDLDGRALGKPHGEEGARAMLRALSGRDHWVHTGVCLLQQGEGRSFVESCRVTFRPLADWEIERYLATGEPFDKAGAYGIQGAAAAFCQRVEGDYFTVLGLPVAHLCQALQELPAPK